MAIGYSIRPEAERRGSTAGNIIFHLYFGAGTTTRTAMGSWKWRRGPSAPESSVLWSVVIVPTVTAGFLHRKRTYLDWNILS